MPAWRIDFSEPLSYAAGIELQEAFHAARVTDRIPDTVLFLQHRPVVTLGARGRQNYLLRSPEQLAATGIDFYKASRGGDVTYHAPGQWVIYPILKLGAHEADAHGYLHNLEELAIRTAADFGVQAYRRTGMNGAWTVAGKIAAIGFRLKRWVTLHGMSFNVSLDLQGFSLIVPCGLVGQPVSSLKAILSDRCPAMETVRDRLARHFVTIFQRPLECPDPAGETPPDLQDLVEKHKQNP